MKIGKWKKYIKDDHPTHYPPKLIENREMCPFNPSERNEFPSNGAKKSFFEKWFDPRTYKDYESNYIKSVFLFLLIYNLGLKIKMRIIHQLQKFLEKWNLEIQSDNWTSLMDALLLFRMKNKFIPFNTFFVSYYYTQRFSWWKLNEQDFSFRIYFPHIFLSFCFLPLKNGIRRRNWARKNSIETNTQYQRGKKKYKISILEKYSNGISDQRGLNIENIFKFCNWKLLGKKILIWLSRTFSIMDLFGCIKYNWKLSTW